jgi:uncharacterized protein (TIGR02145 family)
MKKKTLSIAILGFTALFFGCSGDDAPSPVGPTPIAEVSSSSVQGASPASSSALQQNQNSATSVQIGVKDTVEGHKTINTQAPAVDYPDKFVEPDSTFCWDAGCKANVKPRSSSSKAAPKSSSSANAITIDEPVNKAPTVNGMSMTDTRDNKTYKLMQIGGKLWMAQDINYAVANSECYNEQESNCTTNGRLYTYNAAQKACPLGWHIPTRAEAQAALDNASVPWSYSGRCKDGDCNFLGDMGFHWTSGDPQSSDKKYNDNGGSSGALIIVEKSPDYFTPKEDDPDDKAKFFQVDQKTKRFSVRCVQD